MKRVLKGQVNYALLAATAGVLGMIAAGTFFMRGSSAGDMAGAVDMANVQGAPIDSVPEAVHELPVEGTGQDEPESNSRASEIAIATPAPAKKLDDIDLKNIPVATPVTVAAVAPNGAQPAGEQVQVEAPQAAAAPAAADGDYQPLTWETISNYKYMEPIAPENSKPGDVVPGVEKRIPDAVRALNGKKISIDGFMVPTDIDDGSGVKTFILAKTQPLCCFGDQQGMNEWIDVKMNGDKRAEFYADRPMTVKGTFEVGEQLESGFVLSIYRMVADEVSK